MNKKIILAGVIVLLIGAGVYLTFFKKTAVAPSPQNQQQTTPAPVEYVSTLYGFSFSLPYDWNGYTIVTSTWDGYSAGPTGDIPAENGPIISIRNPNWTSANPYQDIPIMVFTKSQWDNLQKETFRIGAAPIGPSLLGTNSQYVFAIPARYNFAFPTGYQEVDDILNSKPFHHNLTSPSS
jgi:hypothetical protein